MSWQAILGLVLYGIGWVILWEIACRWLNDRSKRRSTGYVYRALERELEDLRGERERLVRNRPRADELLDSEMMSLVQAGTQKLKELRDDIIRDRELSEAVDQAEAGETDRRWT